MRWGGGRRQRAWGSGRKGDWAIKGLGCILNMRVYEGNKLSRFTSDTSSGNSMEDALEAG